MLRVNVSTNAGGAIKYFTDSLTVGDYYAHGQTIMGTWQGKGAAQLGLTGDGRSGEVTPEQFAAMAMNKHPTNGGPLTERTVDKRRVGYDINFHAPKSVSLIQGLTQDQGILNAFQSSVRETMQQMESEMKCRVRAGGADHDRTVGNLCWAEFIHFTARPVNKVADPHLHAHCFTFNSVWDGVEGKWKAGQFGDLKHDAPFFEACFHARLASKLVELGYAIERRGKGWEIANVSNDIIRQYSRRTAQIEAKAAELGISDAERKSELGARTRAKKSESPPLDKLREIWKAGLDGKTREEFTRRPRPDRGRFGDGIERDPAAAVDFAAGVAFERHSVITERELLTAAIRRSLGSVPVEQLQYVIDHTPRFIRQTKDGVKKVTTKEIMAEEERMIDFARSGRGSRLPIAPFHAIKDERLNEQQRAAVMHVLTSTDRVTMIKGGAGTGKTTLMTEAINAMEKSWHSPLRNGRDVVTVLAPSADASRDVLRSEGFKNADTVAKFLNSKTMMANASGGVLWIDEAGLLGSKTMAEVCRVAKWINARIVLSGDPDQHRAVERGDPLRIFEDYAGVKPAHVEKIQRQKGLYKSAVEHLSRGDVAEGFESLRKMGCIHEMPEPEAHQKIAYDYSTSLEKKQSALIVSPTHAEGAKVTKAVRSELERRGTLKGKGRTFDRLEDLRWTLAERGQADHYQKGMVVQFHQNAFGFKAGKKYTVTGNIPGLGVIASGRRLPLDKAKKFNVFSFHEDATEIKKGDRIRITNNGKSKKEKVNARVRPHALNNGACYTVAGFTAGGDIRLNNGWVVSKRYGHFTHGYCTTSHSSQGKTVDRIFIAQSANSFGATSAAQFLVSVSRGRKDCAVYTDDVEGLKRNIEKYTQKAVAVELSPRHERERLERLVVENAKRMAEERTQRKQQEKQRERTTTAKEGESHGR